MLNKMPNDERIEDRVFVSIHILYNIGFFIIKETVYWDDSI